MKEKRTDLGQDVDVRVDAARLARGWEGIEARAFGRPRARRPFAYGALALGAAAAIALLVASLPSAPGALRTASGAAVERAMPREAEGGGTLELDDGSRIRFAEASRVEPLENGGSRFSLLLHEGEARFEVEPGGPRRWVVEAGHVTVEVVGTIFTVTRDADRVRVDVERGRVLVRSDELPERLRALGPGQSVEVLATPVAVATPAPPPPPVAEVTEPMIPAEVAPPETPPATRVAPTPRPTAAALMAEADAARRAGDIDAALAHLRRASAIEGDPEAAIASFTRGRLALSHGRAGEAVTDLERALALGLPAAIEESARHRLVLAQARAGNAAGARAAAADYLARYPDGTFRAEVERAAP